MNPDSVFIVLATCNGEAYLPEQLDSLLAQSLRDWTLLVKDDGSQDGTVGIISDYAARDERVVLLEAMSTGDQTQGSAVQNFATLLQASIDRGAEYVFCCDQDDVWAPDKMERMLSLLKRAEGKAGGPCMVHHDLEVVDASLKVVAPSFWQLMALTPRSEEASERLLSRNEVTGCAVAVNRALLELALPIPADAIMHDWWLALFAAFFGTLRFDPERRVRYRQHGANAIGARSFASGLDPMRNWLVTWRHGNEEFLSTVMQAKAFSESISRQDALELSFGKEEALVNYSSLPYLSRTRRFSALRLARVWRGHWLLDLVLAVRVLLLKQADH